MKMNRQYKIVLFEVIIIILFSIISCIGRHFSLQDVFSMYSLAAVPIGVLNVILAIGFAISNFQKNKEWVISLIFTGVLLAITGYFAFSQVQFSR
jgi:dolichyl-phosphate-mannose--protein O-mannosyl transferase